MHLQELNVEGIGVTVRPEWEKQIAREVAHLESHHPGATTRLNVRFRPLHPHRPGLAITLEGRMALRPFHVEREGKDVFTLIHDAFGIAKRSLDDRTRRDRSRAGLPQPDVDSDEELLETDPHV